MNNLSINDKGYPLLKKLVWKKLPSKHLLVLKMSSTPLLDMSWRRLQNVFSVTILRLPRRLEDILQDVLKTSWRHLEDVLEDEKLLHWRRLEDVLKTCLEDVLKTCLEDVLKTCLEDVLKTCLEDVLKTLWRQAKYLLGISVSNKPKCVSNKSIFHKSIFDNSKANPKWIH